jgi:hypothetical protein
VPLLPSSQDLGGDFIPTETVLHNPIAIGNIAKWAVELAEFDMDFLPHHEVKSHVLADFVADWTLPP